MYKVVITNNVDGLVLQHKAATAGCGRFRKVSEEMEHKCRTGVEAGERVFYNVELTSGPYVYASLSLGTVSSYASQACVAMTARIKDRDYVCMLSSGRFAGGASNNRAGAAILIGSDFAADESHGRLQRLETHGVTPTGGVSDFSKLLSHTFSGDGEYDYFKETAPEMFEISCLFNNRKSGGFVYFSFDPPHQKTNYVTVLGEFRTFLVGDAASVYEGLKKELGLKKRASIEWNDAFVAAFARHFGIEEDELDKAGRDKFRVQIDGDGDGTIQEAELKDFVVRWAASHRVSIRAFLAAC